MAFSVGNSKPDVLVLGHSFVRRLKCDLINGFHPKAHVNYDLASVNITIVGTGGRTVPKLMQYDSVHIMKGYDIVILEIGTNDLGYDRPETVGDNIVQLVHLLHQNGVKVVGVCQVVNRCVLHTQLPDRDFNQEAAKLRQYLSVVLEGAENVFVWKHRDLDTKKQKQFLLLDGVHLNRQGQYLLYRSHRGAILKAVSLLSQANGRMPSVP